MFFSKIGYKQLDRVILGLELKTGTSLGHFPDNITSAHVQFISENLLCRHVILFSTLMHFLIQSEIIWAVSHHVMFTSANNATVCFLLAHLPAGTLFKQLLSIFPLMGTDMNLSCHQT